MSSTYRPGFCSFAATIFLTTLLTVSAASAQTAGAAPVPAAKAPAMVTPPAPVHHPPAMSPRAVEHYQLIWGVDKLDVKAVESGQMIRFSYTVLDPVKSAILNDKKVNPSLIDEQARVRLEIPTMEKVGQLRQTSTPEVGKSYWMVFSNKGGVVKPGDRVSVIIGRFKADGLYVR